MKILGISAYYHDSAAALIIDGQIISAAQEERFTREKYDAGYPHQAISYCLKAANLTLEQLDAVVFYDKPWLKFERILETYYAFAPKGVASFREGLPIWIKEKALLPKLLRKEIPGNVPIKFSSHHLSHAASAFYPSPFESAAILTLDGVGEWATATISQGEGRKLTMLKEMNYPHSVGLLYSSFTQFCGFKVNSGEYKLMGLAPYGRHGHPEVEAFKEKIKNNLCHIYDDGGIWLDQSYFSYATGLEMIDQSKWKDLFGVSMRDPEEKLTQVYCDLALAIQQVTEEIILKLARHTREITGERFLCLAGGVALNCVANGLLKRQDIFDEIWIQPAAGDAGGAVGAALAYYYSFPAHQRTVVKPDSMSGAYLGPEFSKEEIKAYLDLHKVNYQECASEDELCHTSAGLIDQGQVLGWFQGRMEFGPRALGSRSIIADARSPVMQKKLNLKIKYREGFRPFAPSCLIEEVNTYFEEGFSSPYMLLVDHVKPELRNKLPTNYESLSIDERLYFIRSKVPSITHLDFSARLQTVHKDTNPIYHKLISSFKELSGLGMVVNTSFNVRGEPIVCSPEDAVKCFFHTEMDALAIGPFVALKDNQPPETLEAFLKTKTVFKLD